MLNNFHIYQAQEHIIFICYKFLVLLLMNMKFYPYMKDIHMSLVQDLCFQDLILLPTFILFHFQIQILYSFFLILKILLPSNKFLEVGYQVILIKKILLFGEIIFTFISETSTLLSLIYRYIIEIMASLIKDKGTSFLYF